MSEMRQIIRHKIEQLVNIEELTLSDSDPLISSGLLNSIRVVTLASWVEATYGVDFEKNGFNVYDFESVDSIVALINKR